jgi:fumarate reductase flavoprotein subunit
MQRGPLLLTIHALILTIHTLSLASNCETLYDKLIQPIENHLRKRRKFAAMAKEIISRRSFIKGAATGAAGVAAIGLMGACAPQVVTPEAEPTQAQSAVVDATETTPEIPTSPVDGKYVTKSMGHEDFIYVTTEFREGKIFACTVTSHHETMGVGNFACARIPAAIVEHQSINVPNVRGCSTSSRAVKDAVKQAITISGHNVDDFSAEVVEEDVNKSEEKDVDVVVVGAGTAGLVCAAKLLDQGYRVTVIEKRAIPGGSMSMTYSGVVNINTPTVNNYNVDGTVPELYTSMDGWIGVLSGYLDPENDRFEGQMPYQRQAYGAVSEASEWFKTIGIGFCTMGNFEGGYQYGITSYLAPGCYMGGAGYAMMALASRIERHPNGEIIYMTKATELIQDADSKLVTGVKAAGIKSDDSENGYQLTVNAKAVVLASGGFARNKEMLKEYAPEHADFFFNCASESTGDGIQMGLAAGSKMECLNRHMPGYLSSSSYFELAFLHYSTPGILVNADGNNVGNIMSNNHTKMAQIAEEAGNGGKFFYIFDEAGVPVTKDFKQYGFTTYEALFNRGEVLHYDTVDAAVAELGLSGLQAAIDANNKAALSGEADEFGRKNCPFIDTRNGIYIIKTEPTFYLTTSGLCIDTNGRVLTDSFDPAGNNTMIPGLYACGDVCGSSEEKDGKPYGMGFDVNMGFGYTVAQTIETDGVTKSE